MKRNRVKHGSLVLVIAISTITPYAISKNVNHDRFVIRSVCLLPNNERLLVEEVAKIVDELITESQKTVDKLLDSLDKTPLSYFSNHMAFIINQITSITKTLKKHASELPSDTPNEYAQSITLSVDLLDIVTKYLNKVHAILISPKVNTRALKLAKALEKSQAMLEKSFLKCSKKLIQLIEKLGILGLDEQVDKLKSLKGVIDEARSLILNPTAASRAQNIKMVDALNFKIEAEKRKK